MGRLEPQAGAVSTSKSRGRAGTRDSMAGPLESTGIFIPQPQVNSAVS